MKNRIAGRDLANHPMPEITAALRRKSAHLHYSRMEHLFSCFQVDNDRWCGVAGDGDNGAYEWFIYCTGRDLLETSDCGYGDTLVALRDVLNRTQPVETGYSVLRLTPSDQTPIYSTDREEDRWLKRRDIKININEAQFSYIKQLCRGNASPEVMSSTAFTRGLAILGKELEIDWTPDL